MVEISNPIDQGIYKTLKTILEAKWEVFVTEFLSIFDAYVVLDGLNTARLATRTIIGQLTREISIQKNGQKLYLHALLLTFERFYLYKEAEQYANQMQQELTPEIAAMFFGVSFPFDITNPYKEFLQLAEDPQQFVIEAHLYLVSQIQS